MSQSDLDGLVGVIDESDEQAEHHVDEERDEGVMVNRMDSREYEKFKKVEKGVSNVIDDGSIDIKQFDN